jgi:hypothetical protein
MDKNRIRELALANGFKLKDLPDGSVDLKPYVYDFALAIRGASFCKLAAQRDALNALIVSMQERATNYLPPDGERNKDFIGFILGVLDGPEQRAAQLELPKASGWQGLIDPAQVWVIHGRIAFDDDDSVCTFVADDRNDAETQFKQLMITNRLDGIAPDDEDETIIIVDGFRLDGELERLGNIVSGEDK